VITLSHVLPSATNLYRVDADCIRRLILEHLQVEFPIPNGFQYYLKWQDTPDGLVAEISIIVERLTASDPIRDKGIPAGLVFNTDQPDFVPSSMVPDAQEDLD
jgi:hypothetical protein